jgi:hypothetical protein
MIEIASAFFLSLGIGFALNRFVLRKVFPGAKRSALALATSRAVFYAPAIVHVGHGAYIPAPLLITIFYFFREFGPELDVFVFLVPCIVFFASLVVAWLKLRNAQQHTPGDAPKSARP